MRIRRLLLVTIGAAIFLPVILFAALQTPPGLRLAAALLSSALSGPEARIRIVGLEGFFPVDLTIDRVEASDAKGIWLTVDAARLKWNAVSLLSGRLSIEELAARKVAVLRPPQPAEADTGAAPSLPVRLPLGVDLRSLAVEDFHLAAPVARTESRWKFTGKALVPADLAAAELDLVGQRLDGPTGRFTATLRVDGGKRSGQGEVELDEGAGGLVATLLERPDLERLTARLTGRGGPREGVVELSLAAGDVASAIGKAMWRPQDGATDVTLHLDVSGPGLPAGPLADIVRKPVALTAEAVIDDRLAILKDARLTVGPLQLGATARYDRAEDRLSATATLQAGDAGNLTALIGGIGWRGLRLEAVADLAGLTTEPSGSVVLSGAAEELVVASIDGRLPAPGRTSVAARLGLRDGSLLVESFNLGSPLVALDGTGSYLLKAGTARATASVSVPSFAPFSALAGRALVGSGAIDLDVESRDGALAVTWQGQLREAGAAGLPRGVISADVALKGEATLARDGTWTVRDASIASDTGTLDLHASGRAAAGTLELSLSLPRLAAFRDDVAGAATASSTISFGGNETTLSVSAEMSNLAHGPLEARRLMLKGETRLARDGTATGKLDLEGELDGRPLRLDGTFGRDPSGGIVVPAMQGSWSGAALDVTSLEVTPSVTTGRAQLRIERLQEFAVLIGADVRGALDATVVADSAVPSGRLNVDVRGTGFGTAGVSAATLALTGTIDDPLGIGRTDLSLVTTGVTGASGVTALVASAKGDRGGLDITAQATGATSANVAARIEQTAAEIVVALERFEGRYQSIPVTLTAPSRIRIADERIAIAPATLRVGSGRAAVQGTLDPVASDLGVDITALPLSLIDAVAPGTGLEGSLNARLRIVGPMGGPRVDASYNAAGVRVRRPEAALVPALALRGTGSLAGSEVRLDARLSTAGATSLSVKGQATLPNGGRALTGEVTVAGTADMAPFAPLLGNDIRGVTGILRPNLSLAVAAGRVSGRGTIDFSGGTIALPESGLRLDGGEGRLSLQDDTVRVERLVFRTGARGTASFGGAMRLDATRGVVLDLSIATRRALLVSRPDLAATISSDLTVRGASAEGFDIAGPITIDRAEIRIGAAQAVDYPTLEVREINRPGEPAAVASGKAQVRKPPPPDATPIRLALEISAPQAVFVRGRGLDAEMSGQLQVGGTPFAPTVVGGLNLRRGDFTLGGRRLTFSKGIVTLDNLDAIDPRLDFLASVPAQSATVGVAITGTSRAPVFTVTSTPSMPADEAMALLIFGRPASTLGASELLQVAAAVAELTGRSPGAGVLSRLRRGLGLDRLSVGSSGSSGSGAGSSVSLEAGRYVAPGVYVGARQGAAGNSSRGVVQLDVLDNVKIEGDIGADSNGRVGIKMEWDY